MRIILIGQAAFAEKTLEKLLGKGEEVVAVYCPPDPPGGKFDPVKQKALQLGIPVRQHKSFKAPEVSAKNLLRSRPTWRFSLSSAYRSPRKCSASRAQAAFVFIRRSCLNIAAPARSIGL